jgi:hypothetical protein
MDTSADIAVASPAQAGAAKAKMDSDAATVGNIDHRQ